MHNIVKFHWEMVSLQTGDIACVGLEILTRGPGLRIGTDYQFIEA